MNHKMAAAAKNSEPMIALSRALTGKTWDSKPPISAGKSQQTVPATAKKMAKPFSRYVGAEILSGVAKLPRP
jgi:hypothetical protein